MQCSLCALYHSKFDFGNLIDSSLEDVWNSNHYRSSRRLFSEKVTTVNLRRPVMCALCSSTLLDTVRWSGSNTRSTLSQPCMCTCGLPVVTVTSDDN